MVMFSWAKTGGVMVARLDTTPIPNAATIAIATKCFQIHGPPYYFIIYKFPKATPCSILNNPHKISSQLPGDN
jgi:hypothetical protein